MKQNTMLGKLKIDTSLVAAMKHMQKQQEVQAEAAPVPLRPVDPKLPFCIVIDIDRTLALRSPKRGIFEFEKAGEDESVPATKYLVQALWAFQENEQTAQQMQLIVWTGRERKFEETVRLWLITNEIPFHQLLMRTTGSFEEAKILKENLYVNNIAHKFNVLFILDDDVKVTTHLRKTYGLYCLRPEIL